MVLTDAEILELGADIDLVQRVSAMNEKNEKDLQIKLLNCLLKSYDPTTKENGEISDELKAEIVRIKEASKATEKYRKDLTKRLLNALEKQASSSQSMVDNNKHYKKN